MNPRLTLRLFLRFLLGRLLLAFAALARLGGASGASRLRRRPRFARRRASRGGALLRSAWLSSAGSSSLFVWIHRASLLVAQMLRVAPGLGALALLHRYASSFA